jgi:hypothetical protein
VWRASFLLSSCSDKLADWNLIVYVIKYYVFFECFLYPFH